MPYVHIKNPNYSLYAGEAVNSEKSDPPLCTLFKYASSKAYIVRV